LSPNAKDYNWKIKKVGKADGQWDEEKVRRQRGWAWNRIQLPIPVEWGTIRRGQGLFNSRQT